MKLTLQKLLFSLSISVIAFSVTKAQQEIIFSPADLVPHQDGYYISGVEVDEDDNGVLEFHNQCEDYYENFLNPHDNHAETGEQQGFTYVNTMIMPTCEAKNPLTENPIGIGYIQLSPGMFTLKDTVETAKVFSYVQTPAIRNLISLELELSSDVSINDNRRIPYYIEISLDNGATWELTPYIEGGVEVQGGYRITYTAEDLSFKDMIDVSVNQSIVLRIVSNDVSLERPNKGQYVKIHKIIVTAELSTAIPAVQTNLSDEIIINDLTIASKTNSTLTVYNQLGQLIGTGEQVIVPSEGLYIIEANNNTIKKLVFK